MNQMKRWIALLLALVMLLGLAACGGDTKEDSRKDDEDVSDEREEEKDEDEDEDEEDKEPEEDKNADEEQPEPEAEDEKPAAPAEPAEPEEPVCEHVRNEATCIAPAICAVCGEADGEPNPDAHDFAEATCTEPAACELCGLTDGEALGHSNVGGSCERCGIVMATPIAEQETVTLDGVCEFYVDRSQITSRVEPPTPGSYYSYYQLEDQSLTYVDVCIAYKNLATSNLRADDAFSASLTYGGKYHYDGFSIIEEDNRSDFTYSNITDIAPLTTGYIHFLFEVPAEVTETNKLIEVTLSNGGSDFVYTVQAGDGELFGADDLTTTKESGEVVMGEAVTIGGQAEFSVERSQIAARIDPPSPGSYYSYYEIEDPQQIYLDVCFAVRNLKTDGVRADDMIEATVLYADTYEFTGFTIIEEDNRSDFTYSNITDVRPLTTGYIHYLFKLPLEVQTSGESLVVNFTIGGCNYSYTVVG